MSTLRVQDVPDYVALSATVGDAILETVAARPDATLLLATGRTPMGAFAHVAAHAAPRGVDFKRVRVVQLDEYVGCDGDDPRSLLAWLQRSFIDPLAIPPENLAALDGCAADLDAVCEAHDAAIEEWGGVDLAVLGIGMNGHLGFNEPPADPASRTHSVALSDASVRGSAAYWGRESDVPPIALTVGMSSILAAGRVVLAAAGEAKREILAATVHGPITVDVPASLLRRADRVDVIADRAAYPVVP